MTPNLSPGLLAAVDGAELHLREWLSCFPLIDTDLRESTHTQRTVQMVSVDVLAALSEAWEAPVEDRLNLITARLLAWQRLTER